MTKERTHEFRVTTRWTGNLGAGTSAYTAYSRAHECTGDGKVANIVRRRAAFELQANKGRAAVDRAKQPSRRCDVKDIG